MRCAILALAALLAGCQSGEADDVVEFDCGYLTTEVLEIEFEYTTYKDRCDSDDDVIVSPALL